MSRGGVGRLVPLMLGVWLGGCASGGPAATLSAPIAGDPGAAKLVRSMRRSLESAGFNPWGETLIAVDGIRNHSHAAASEFDAMRRRLAEALTRSARDPVPMRFVVNAGEPVDGELEGTAYLVTAGGFDQWELYLSLRLAGGSWTVWNADGAVRMLRQPRTGETELFLD